MMRCPSTTKYFFQETPGTSTVLIFIMSALLICPVGFDPGAPRGGGILHPRERLPAPQKQLHVHYVQPHTHLNGKTVAKVLHPFSVRQQGVKHLANHLIAYLVIRYCIPPILRSRFALSRSIVVLAGATATAVPNLTGINANDRVHSQKR